MKKLKKGLRREFYIFSKAWHAPYNKLTPNNVIEEIIVGLYHKDGGTAGEMKFNWEYLGHKLAMRISIFDDALNLLTEFSDLFKELSKLNGTTPSVEEVVKLLKSLKFTDGTPIERNS